MEPVLIPVPCHLTHKKSGLLKKEIFAYIHALTLNTYTGMGLALIHVLPCLHHRSRMIKIFAIFLANRPNICIGMELALTLVPCHFVKKSEAPLKKEHFVYIHAFYLSTYIGTEAVLILVPCHIPHNSSGLRNQEISAFTLAFNPSTSIGREPALTHVLRLLLLKRASH